MVFQCCICKKNLKNNKILCKKCEAQIGLWDGIKRIKHLPQQRTYTANNIPLSDMLYHGSNYE